MTKLTLSDLKITADDVINYRLYLKKHKNNRTGNYLAKSTIRTIIPAINKFCEIYQIKNKINKDNRFNTNNNSIYLKFKLPKQGKPIRELMPLTRNELQKVFEASKENPNEIEQLRNYAIMRIMYCCAMRRSEVQGLNVDDVYRVTREINGVEKSLPYVRIGNLDFTPKDYSHGVVLIDEETFDAIQKYKEVRNPFLKIGNIELKLELKEEEINETKLKLQKARENKQEWKVEKLKKRIKSLWVQYNRLKDKKELINDSNKAMFLSSQRKRMSTSNIDTIFKNIGIKTGLIKKKPFTSHIMRKTRATLLDKAGWSLDEIKGVTRHKSTEALQGYIKRTDAEISEKLYNSYQQSNKTELTVQPIKPKTEIKTDNYPILAKMVKDNIISKAEMMKRLGV